jgi:serine/threonine-protein kinase
MLMNPPPQASAAAGMGPITVGALLAGRYRVTARIGAGGMATIYRAHDESLERDVAVKVLHPHLAHDDSLQVRFRAEARAAAGLLHPNIVNVFDQGAGEVPYIVMEYVDGPSLREVLDRRGRLNPGEALAVIEPVVQALRRAHAAGLVHRDVKPENVLIAADGTVKVADFGIARAMAETSHTATGMLIGSVHYLAPELMKGEPATARSDQYAVGVVLFELLTNRKPLPAETPMAVAMRHAQERIPPTRQFVKGVPPAVDAVIARATEWDPQRRYPDLASMVMALRSAIPGGATPVVIDPPGNTDGTLIIPVEAQDTVTLPTSTPKRRMRRRLGPPPRPRSRRRMVLVALLVLVAAAAAFAGWNYVVAPVTTAPNVLGLSQEEAVRKAQAAGLSLDIVEERNDRTVPAGDIITQEPEPEGAIRRGQGLAVVVSAGPATVSVPDVKGRDARAATQRLEAAPRFLDVKVEQVFSDSVPRGEVVSQEPGAGATIEQGATVTLRVSKGIEQVDVPDVLGMAKREAAAELKRRGLSVTFEQAYSDKFPEPGSVAEQSVSQGTAVDKGTAITLTISQGAQTIALGSYIGQGLEQARAALLALDLQVRVIEQERPVIGPSRQGVYGRVEAQAPDPGTAVERGEIINLYTFSAAADAEDDD